MPLDWEKLKQRITNHSAKQEEPVPVVVEPKPKAVSPLVAEMKQGVQDVKAVLAEGNYKLFAKQIVVILLAFLGVRFLMGKLSVQKEQIVDKISALSIQQTNESDYLANKERLLNLEPLFPDLAKKNEWLLQTLMKIFEDHKIQANIDGNAAENVATDYTTVAQLVTFQQGFMPLGKFLADVENGDNFLRISEITISKITDTALLGENSVSVRFNTLFPKEKYAKRLFKDYAQQMAQLEAQKKSTSEKQSTSEQPQTSEPAVANEPTPENVQPTAAAVEPQGGAQ